MRKKILVCDDDELLRDLPQFRLTSFGYSVSFGPDGGEADAS